MTSANEVKKIQYLAREFNQADAQAVGYSSGHPMTVRAAAAWENFRLAVRSASDEVIFLAGCGDMAVQEFIGQILYRCK